MQSQISHSCAHHFVVVLEETIQSIFPVHFYTSDRAHLHISASRDQGYFKAITRMNTAIKHMNTAITHEHGYYTHEHGY